MFWSSKIKIPAPLDKRHALIKKMYLYRVDRDPTLQAGARAMGVDPRDISGGEIYLGFPEGAILRIVEHYYALFDKVSNDNEVVQTLSEYFGNIALGDGTYPPMVPPGTDFLSYLRLFVDAITRGGAPISNDILTAYFIAIKDFYKR